jgi:nitrate/nitrite transport system substrate-binding protein
LCDSAPLIVAKERGFFAEQGLSVELSKEPSWSNIRDKLAVGLLDAAQLLAPMVLSGTLGLGNMRVPLTTVMALNRGGNAITLGMPLLRRLTVCCWPPAHVPLSCRCPALSCRRWSPSAMWMTSPA